MGPILDYARRWRWAKQAPLGGVLLLWGVSIFASVEYRFAVTKYGPLADGSAHGYEMVRAVGVQQGAVVYQTLHRQQHIGFFAEWRPLRCRWWVFIREGWSWTETTTGIPLIWVVAWIASTLPPRLLRPDEPSMPRCD